uniref:PHD-type domain-containing protein n=1 Tax=Ditylenchus dipsaci TaxID=166011 RepID=A0A915DLU0_9BILA
MEDDEEKTEVAILDSTNPSNVVFAQSSKVSCDKEVLQQIGSSITPAFWENVKNFAAEEQRFESLRTVIFSKLNVLSKVLYDYQLVEHASQASLLQVAKTAFLFNKKRCAKKVATVKVKPAKKQKLESSLPVRDARKAERDQKSPTLPKNHAHNIPSNPDGPSSFIVSASSQLVVKEDCPLPATVSINKKGPKGARKSNRDKLAASLINPKPEISPESPTPADVEMVVKEETPSLEDSTDEKSQPLEKIANASTSKKEVSVDIRQDEPSTPVISPDPILSSPPRKRAAAVAAAMIVTDTINPPRSSSPRKKINGNSNAAEEDVQPDEPTYCLCEQVSFGDMICCDFSKCPVEWFHFSCVNIKIKPKGKKWFCPLCRGDKPTILKSSLLKK